jgi:hypothetical protein
MKYMQQARWIAGAVPRSTSAFEYRKKRGEELQEIEEAALGMCAPHDILPEIQDGDSALNEDFTLLACGNRHISFPSKCITTTGNQTLHGAVVSPRPTTSWLPRTGRKTNALDEVGENTMFMEDAQGELTPQGHQWSLAF